MGPSPRNPLDGAFFDLSERVKLCITGEDRHRYVNGQITNDVRKLTDSTAIAACVLNVKGKTDAHVFVSQKENGLVMDAEPGLSPSLQPRLERYVVADDVQIVDVTGESSILHVIGAVPELASGRIISANRFGVPGHDVWIDRMQRDEVFDALARTIPFGNADQTEVFRIEQGIPRWGHELTADIIPVEANLEESCIDYEKGCYIGQEIISRMKMSGQRNKRLIGFIAEDESVLVPDARLSSGEGKESGWITSVANSERFGRRIALGYIKRGADVPAGIKIVDLPFSADSLGSD